MNNKRFLLVLVVVLLILAVTIGTARGAGQTPIPEPTTRSEQTVTVVQQKRIIPLGCMHLTGALLQVRERAILSDDVRTPFTEWRTVRILEYYSNPNFPACQG